MPSSTEQKYNWTLSTYHFVWNTMACKEVLVGLLMLLLKTKLKLSSNCLGKYEGT